MGDFLDLFQASFISLIIRLGDFLGYTTPAELMDLAIKAGLIMLVVAVRAYDVHKFNKYENRLDLMDQRQGFQKIFMEKQEERYNEAKRAERRYSIIFGRILERFKMRE